METGINTSNSDEDGLLGGQSLALSTSENDENSKYELKISPQSKQNVSNSNYNTMLEDINNPIISEENNLKHKTKQGLNEQGYFNFAENNINPKKCNNEEKVNVVTINTINSDNLKLGINEEGVSHIEIDSKNLENTLNSNSDSENKITRKRVKCISYSEDDENFIEKKYIDDNIISDKQISATSESKKQKDKKISSIIDSESDEELHSSNVQHTSEDQNINKKDNLGTNHKKISGIIDTESDEDHEVELNDEVYNNFNSEEHTKIQINYNKKPRQERAAAKIALDTISAIKSETQRMHRESEINVPYHKPRNCTLKEFMARKSQDVLKNVVTKTNSKGLSLKMTETELENYANYLEKREKESQELFANEEEMVFTTDTTAVKEDNEPFGPMVNLNDIPNSEIEKSSKVQIISNILITAPIITNEPPPVPTLNITNLKKLLEDDKDLIASPTLQGDSKCIIDLESGDMIPSTLETPKSGVDKLFERFLKSSGCKKRNDSSKNSPTITDNEFKNLSCNNSLINDDKKERKPGASYIALKNNLRKIIFESRKTVLDKKINDFKIENKIVEQICAEEDEDDYESDNDEEGEDIERDDYEIGENLEEGAIDKTEEDNIDENDDADDESDDSIEIVDKRNKKLSHRVIKRFDDDSDTDSDSQEYNFLNNSTKQAIQIEIKKTQQEELLELCSGKFDLTQNESEITTSVFVVPTTQLATQFNESQLEALCSGTFTNSIKEIPNTGLILNENENEEELFKKMHKNKTANKISYSDDEDEDEEKNYNINNFKENMESKKLNNMEDETDEEEEQLDTYIDYDSDENEIKVEMTKADRKMRAKDFVEKEAELSESEWGSADEDEKDLDRYDIELGDEDQYDQDKLQSELGKIHMRKMMDEDAREVKKMQELLFDDEENDGLGRQRQFRWRKTENGFDINDNADADQENKESCDDDEENEEQWRKMKHEREVLLMEKQNLVEGNKIILSPLKLNNSNQIDKINLDIDSTKILINKSKKNIDLKNVENDSPFLISKNSCGGIRGSFLKRDKELLSKVAASLISSKEINNINNDDDDIGRVKTTTGKHNNFVFTILSQPPQVQQTNKRKLSDIIDTNKSIKKSKLISNKFKKNLIDHLDLSEC